MTATTINRTENPYGLHTQTALHTDLQVKGGAVNEKNEHSTFSNYGPDLELMTPRLNIRTNRSDALV